MIVSTDIAVFNRFGSKLYERSDISVLGRDLQGRVVMEVNAKSALVSVRMTPDETKQLIDSLKEQL